MKQLPIDIIERGLEDDDFCVRKAAMKACQGRSDISSDEECSTGFHFFCSLQEAENYN